MMMSYSGNMEIGHVAKPPVAYGNAVKLTPSATGEPRQDLPGKVARPLEPAQTADLSPKQPEALAVRRRPMESRSDPTVLYLHPDGKYELTRIIHRTARNRPRPPNTWARDFIAKNFIKQPIRIVVNDINGLALTAHFS